MPRSLQTDNFIAMVVDYNLPRGRLLAVLQNDEEKRASSYW